MSTIIERRSALTVERVRELLDYNPQTGVFLWRKSTNNRVPAGSVAGCLTENGYAKIGIDGERYRAHRLAWFYVHGEWPEADVDHQNRDRISNAKDNLRPASRSENNANAARRSDNVTGFKGVGFYRRYQRWTARVRKHGRCYFLGYFDTPEAAHAAYVAKAREIYGDFARAA